VTERQKLTISVPAAIHREFKAACIRRGTTATHELRAFMEHRTVELNDLREAPRTTLALKRRMENVSSKCSGLVEEIRSLLDSTADQGPG
jgi:hypothetical protein